MVSDSKHSSIQLCVRDNFLEDVVTQLYPDLMISNENPPKIDNSYELFIIEIHQAREVFSYIKLFEKVVAKVIFIVPSGFVIPEINSHNIYFIRKPLRISHLKPLLSSTFKKASLELDGCLIDEKSKSVIVTCDDNIKEKIRLTNREFDIVYFIVEATDAVLKKDILQCVFGYNELSNTNTVDVHLHRLKQKLSKHIDISKYIKE